MRRIITRTVTTITTVTTTITWNEEVPLPAPAEPPASTQGGPAPAEQPATQRVSAPDDGPADA